MNMHTRYCTGNFVERYKTTIGSDFATKELVVGDQLITLQLWVTETATKPQAPSTARKKEGRGKASCISMH